MGRPIMAFLSWPPSRLLAVCHNLWSIELWHDAVLGLSHPNYPMLNDIKLPLCYKSTTEHNSFVYCLSILCPFLAPSPSPHLSRVKMCKSAFQSNWGPIFFCAANDLHFVVGVLSKMVWVRHSSENHRTFICRLGNKFDPGVTTDLERLQTYFQISPV